MIDLAIVGAGAAGIAAGREARRRGLTSMILEASNRIGGRTRTIDWQGRALDLGATWLHSAESNVLAKLAEKQGVPVDRAPTPWRSQLGNLGYSRQEQAESWAAMEAFATRLRAGPRDDRASNALEPGNEWNGFLEGLNGYLNGTGLANSSAADFIAYWDASGNSNWRLPCGYGAFVEQLAKGLDVRTGCQVQHVEWASDAVRLSSDHGTIEARRAIIAVPTNVLASGDIAFAAGVDDHLHAAANLPLGRVEKLFLTSSDPASVPANSHLIGNPRAMDTGSYMLRPLGMPMIESFFGGDWLKDIDTSELAGKAREELGNLLGSEFARRLSPVAHSDWKNHAFIRGSYSYATPGHHGARAILRGSVDGPLAFAGEACPDHEYATVHGAWQSGIGAVGQLFGERAHAG